MGYFNDLRLTAGHCFLPKESADKPLGEDAYFICDGEQTIGVADGVGGWSEVGIDSGVYARELMGNASQFVRNRYSIYGGVDPMAALHHTFEKTIAEGASTACIITLRNSILHAVNVGDSGFRVIRGGKVVYKSPVQQSYFNCPFQLGVNPIGNTPDDADEIIFEVQSGDVIVAATDGLFDNMFDEELEWLVTDSLEKDASVSPDSIACRVGKMAREVSLYFDDEVSPFTLAATKAGLDRETYLGGKNDDITIVVGFID